MTIDQMIGLGGLAIAAMVLLRDSLSRWRKDGATTAADDAREASTVKELGAALARNFQQQDKLNDEFRQHLVECAQQKGEQAAGARAQAASIDKLTRAVEQLQSQMRFKAVGADNLSVEMKG